MAKERSKNSVKHFTKVLSDSSQKLLAAFLNDDIKLNKDKDKLRKQIHQACSQNSFVVLQIAETNSLNAEFETAAGKLKKNKNNPDIIILSDQQTKKIRMIPIDHIKKVSFLKQKLAKKEQRQIT